MRRYKVTVEDESHLTNVITRRFNLLGVSCIILILTVFAFCIAGLIIFFTPLRSLLPGYMQETQRSATEEELLRLDSLTEVFEQDRAFIDNFLKVTDTDRTPTDSASAVATLRPANGDTLLTASKAEKAFVAKMEENERFNVSVLSPLAAENLNFYPVSSEGIFTNESRSQTEGKIIMPADGNVSSAADGTVIAVYYSAPERGYVINVQHNHGFVSSYSHLGSPLVALGDEVNGGQVIASNPSPDSRGTRWIKTRLWHNGLPLTPYDYLGVKDKTGTIPAPKYEDPRGR